jgi:hypothetical protein
MKLHECKVNVQVMDYWYPFQGIGTIVEVLKTRIKVKFSITEETVVYDLQHLQFLMSLDEFREKYPKVF